MPRICDANVSPRQFIGGKRPATATRKLSRVNVSEGIGEVVAGQEPSMEAGLWG
ncbi:MAG: hypothetical protein QF437_26445 [Planctomycetota bacterium]|nr:hypothetical protein [Planctomycetota bacterium]MDP7134066.1 hypothetical protein [Planctomycetota bacterium]MDP7250622.1 hypothetical protein [Planctomycetota bacterium]